MLLLKEIEIKSFKGLEKVRLDGCGRINALVGKNNSGKSSILHAIDMASLALEVNSWDSFQPKLQIKDLFIDVGSFSIDITYSSGDAVKITANPNFGPTKEPQPTDDQKFKSILIWPDASTGMRDRRHKTPVQIIQRVENRDFSDIDSLDMLFAIKYYSEKRERGFSLEIYEGLINEIKRYFPDIDEVESDRTEQDIATLVYEEYGKSLDILYSGSGLKHFIDILLKTSVSQANVVLLDEPEMGLHPDLQRRFIDYLQRLAVEKDLQIFMATHSPVLLNYADTVTYFRVLNSKGTRSVIAVPADAVHTVLSDMGIRPSDIFNQDICFMVEGASEVVFFEHILHDLYDDDLKGIAVGVIQYAGGAADGIISGNISVGNIVPAQKYTFWIRDRDARPSDPPATTNTKFKNALEGDDIECHIWANREIEYYYPKEVLVAAQQGDSEKEKDIISILLGDQSKKFRDAATERNVCVPSGKFLRRLLKEHCKSKDLLHREIRGIVENKIIPWKREILGQDEP